MNNQSQTTEKAFINKFTITPSGYGHWKVSIEAENPNLKLPESDYYWTINDRDDEPETIQISHITTDSRAIDEENEYALLSECLLGTDFSIEDFDTSNIKNGL